MPGEKPHIWQEFKRDLDLYRPPGQPVIGIGWPIMVVIVIVFLVKFQMASEGGPEWLIAIRNLF